MGFRKPKGVNTVSKLHNKFVIMLDADLEVLSAEWPVLTVDNTLEAARAQFDYKGSPARVPRAKHAAEFRENKSLMRRGSGEPQKGGIYFLTDK